MDKKLKRSSTDKKLSGVLGGLAEYLSMDATVIRLIFVGLLIFTGFFPGLILYIIAAMVMPER